MVIVNNIFVTIIRMNKIYIVCNSYNPNTAPTNRLLSFLKGFSELGLKVEVVFLESDSIFSKATEFYPISASTICGIG